MKLVKALGFFIFSLVVLASLCLLLIYTIRREKVQTELISPLVETVSQKTHAIRSLFITGIDKIVFDSLDQAVGTYSIIVINMKNHEVYSQNPDRVYESASLYKLWVMACVYQQLSTGRLNNGESLSDSVEDLNRTFQIASSEAELTTGKISYTVKEALTNMITVSDNYSALLLTKKIGISSLNTFLKQQGLTHSKTGTPPTTTASDIALFYTKLYKHQLTDSQEMIELLKKQAINDRIPKYLPDGISVAHKTGELDTFKHDAGIVFTQKGDYILVMLSDTNDPAVAAEKMAELSKQIYLHYVKTN